MSVVVPAVRPVRSASTVWIRRVRRGIVVYLPLVVLAAFFLMPLYVVLITGFKPFAEVSLQDMWSPPSRLDTSAFGKAFDTLAPNLLNSVLLVVPGAILSAALGSINGFVLSRWRFRGANLVFTLILFGMFIPYQAILIPLVQFMRTIGL